jgi:tryptophan-rich sensory protein
MSQALARILVRCVGIGAGLATYAWVAPRVWRTEEGDANIGLGLLAFAVLMIASAAWALVDGTRRPFTAVAVVWLAVAAVISLGWTVTLAIAQADESMSTTDLLVADAGLVPFAFGLVVVPALLAGAVGQAVANRHR